MAIILDETIDELLDELGDYIFDELDDGSGNFTSPVSTVTVLNEEDTIKIIEVTDENLTLID